MKLYATITNENGKTVSKSGNILKIEIKRGNKLWETLIIKHEDNIVEPMNYSQSNDGYTITTDYGKRLSYILDTAKS